MNKRALLKSRFIIVLAAMLTLAGVDANAQEKYYWYAGTTLPTADNIASIATGSSDEIEKWTKGKKFETTNETGETCPVYTCVPVAFNVIWKDTNGFDLNLIPVSKFIYKGVEYIVRKRGRDLSSGAEFTAVAYYSDAPINEYYWYGGPDMLTSETVPGLGTIYPTPATSEDQIGWHRINVISGTPSYIETGQLNYGEKINWVLAVPTALGLTRISNGEDVTDAYDVSTVTTADGVEYTVFRQTTATKRIDIGFVDGKTKYYWYFGTTLPTEANLTSIATGEEDYPCWGFGNRVKLYNGTEESADMYICIPVYYYDNGLVWRDAEGNPVDVVDVSTFALGSTEYKVKKLGTPLGAGEKIYIYSMAEPANVKGDLNGDGNVDVGDIMAIINIMAGL